VPPAVRDPGVNARQHVQRDRIGQGVRSGELTKQETKELAAEQRAIRKEEREYQSDGKLTKEERKDLHQDLNAASRNIYEQKHDAEKR
jgi:polyhydroxyalkanoate synthesis regulator phasin